MFAFGVKAVITSNHFEAIQTAVEMSALNPKKFMRLTLSDGVQEKHLINTTVVYDQLPSRLAFHLV